MNDASGDTIRSLSAKILDLKRHRDALQNDAAQDSAEVTQLETEIQRVAADLELRVRAQDQRAEKLRRISLIVQETEAALRKISDSTAKLDQVIENELAAVKKSY